MVYHTQIIFLKQKSSIIWHKWLSQATNGSEWEDLCKIHEDLWSINKISVIPAEPKKICEICEICVICVPNNFSDFRDFCVTNICLSARIFVPLYSRRTYISMLQNSITSLGRAELAQKYFPFIQPQSAWIKLKSLLAEDPCLAPLTKLKRRTFLPSEVANIYASLGHPWPPGPPPLRGGRERSVMYFHQRPERPQPPLFSPISGSPGFHDGKLRFSYDESDGFMPWKCGFRQGIASAISTISLM